MASTTWWKEHQQGSSKGGVYQKKLQIAKSKQSSGKKLTGDEIDVLARESLYKANEVPLMPKDDKNQEEFIKKIIDLREKITSPEAPKEVRDTFNKRAKELQDKQAEAAEKTIESPKPEPAEEPSGESTSDYLDAHNLPTAPGSSSFEAMVRPFPTVDDLVKGVNPWKTLSKNEDDPRRREREPAWGGIFPPSWSDTPPWSRSRHDPSYRSPEDHRKEVKEYERRLEENPDDPSTPPWRPAPVIAEDRSAGPFEGSAPDSDDVNRPDDESGPFSDHDDNNVDEGLFSGGKMADSEDSEGEDEDVDDETTSDEDGNDEE